MEERRKLKRSIRYLNVKEPATGKLISHTGDVHYEGLMLVSESRIASRMNIPILLEVPGESGIKYRIPLIINGIWAQMDKDPILYKTGCKIVNPPPVSLCKIKEVISSKYDGVLTKYKIPRAILDETECSRDIGCLIDGKCKNRFRCEADFIGSQNVTFLKPGVSREVLQQCQYVFSAYDKLICKCPVRYYLFEEYAI